MLYNIIQIVAFQALFLLVYDLVFRKETFFNYNRAYLLISSVLSLVLPFLKLPRLQSVTTKDFVIELPEVLIGVETLTENEIQIAEITGITVEQSSQPIWQTILIIGGCIALALFLFKLSKIFWMRSNNPKRWRNNVLVVRLIESTKVFSFFNMIFLGDRIPEKEQSTIYNHELVHIKELHSLDLLFFEILRIIFWFNPLVYIYQNRIKELHEYIADAKAVKHHGASNYYQALLNQIFDVNNVSFTNTFFNKSLIKKRIAMLQKSRSKKTNLLKYTLLLPVVLVMLIYTSTEVKAQQNLETQSYRNQEPTEEQLIKKYYDQIVAMKNNGADFAEISEFAGIGKKYLDKYVLSKEAFLKSKAYMEYVADDMIRRKSEQGVLTDKDTDLANKMKLRGTYAEHREWLKTKEAMTHWESYARDGQLRLVVGDLANKTKEEQARFDALLDQLSNDKAFTSLIVCDTKGSSRLELFSDEPTDSPEKKIEAEESIEVPFAVIDEVPTTLECKDLPTNAERKKCMSQFVAKHVNKNFNLGLADSLGVTGRQRIFVSFKIDKEGLIKDVRARASKKEFETEAIRVIKTLPQFTPGKQKGKTVIVPYSLPIVFQIAESKKSTSTKEQEENEVSESSKTYQSIKELEKQRDRILKSSSPKNPVVIKLNEQIEILKQSLSETVEKTEIEDLSNSDKNASENNESDRFDLYPTHLDCVNLDTEDERKKCTTVEVSIFVNKNFNTKMASTLDLSEERQRIIASFTVGKDGAVKDVKVNASHPKLIEETERVINLLPQFKPGEKKGEKVEVPFTLPIYFKVVKDKKKKD